MAYLRSDAGPGLGNKSCFSGSINPARLKRSRIIPPLTFMSSCELECKLKQKKTRKFNSTNSHRTTFSTSDKTINNSPLDLLCTCNLSKEIISLALKKKSRISERF